MECNTMKRLRNGCLALFALLLAVSCERPYELRLDLALSRNEIKEKAPAGKDYIKVYSTGSWTITPVSGGDWIHFETLSGKGTVQVNFTYDENKSMSREARYTVSSPEAGKTLELYIAQDKGMSSDISYTLSKSTVLLIGDAVGINIPVKTNVPQDNIDIAVCEVKYDDPDNAGWISHVKPYKDRFCFDIAANDGAYRSASISVTFPVPYWDVPVTATLQVTQGLTSPSFGTVVSTYAAPSDGIGMVNIDLGLNFSPDLYDFVFKQEYSADASWLISPAVTADGAFQAAVRPNTTDARNVTLTLSLTNRSGRIFDQRSIKITQAKAVLGSETGENDGGEEIMDPEVDF